MTDKKTIYSSCKYKLLDTKIGKDRPLMHPDKRLEGNV